MNKYKMFRNYMANELEITKEDIKQWTREAVYEAAKDFIEHHISPYYINDRIDELLFKKWSTQLKPQIKEAIAERIASKIELSIKKNTTNSSKGESKDQSTLKWWEGEPEERCNDLCHEI